MKKSELVVGNEYYVCSSQEWMSATWGVDRVRVTNTQYGKWKWSVKTNGFEPSHLSSAMSGIVVERLNPETGAVTGQAVVTLPSIRGEWAATKAQVDTHQAAIAAAVAENKKRRELAAQNTGKAVALAAQLRVPGVKSDVYGQKVEIDPVILIALLNALDASGWKFGQVMAA